MWPVPATGRWRWNLRRPAPAQWQSTWDRLHGYLLRFGQRAAATFCRLKQSRVVTHNSHKNMSTKSPECYTTDSHARCLRVQMTATRWLVLPLDQFVFAELDGDGKEQKLRLVFATHEILITGHVLQRIETAIHRLELSGLMKLPEKYHALIPENQPKIREIVVTENKPSDVQSQSSLN